MATAETSAMPADPWTSEDPLGEALHFLRMSGAFYCRSELTEPWGLGMPQMPGYVWFHVVVSGRMWLDAGSDKETGTGAATGMGAGRDPVLMQRGDLALVPRGEGHELGSEPGIEAPGVLELEREEISERYEVLRHGGGGERTTLICGAVRFDHPAARNLIEILPAALHVPASDDPRADRIQSVLRLMGAEAAELRPGGEAVITRLGDILVIQAIRAWLETDPAAEKGWLGALQDPQIGQAISLIHRDPARDWTVAELAGELAMSRSAFAARFSDLVGEPAMAYVTRWRMQLAYDALRNEGATVGELAARLGYRSEAAFARAFKRVMDVPPGAVRRGATDAPDPLAELAVA